MVICNECCDNKKQLDLNQLSFISTLDRGEPYICCQKSAKSWASYHTMSKYNEINGILMFFVCILNAI